MRLDEPIDDTHRDCIEAATWIRNRFIYIREGISRWEPTPCPPQVIPIRVDAIYADELPRKAWFRT